MNRDVCRKHTIHCPSKQTQEEVPNLKRGQKPRACDACFHSKQSCDTSEPCERCVSRRLTCTYKRLEETSPAPTSNGSSTTPPSSSTTAVGTPNENKDRTKITVAFLLGLTNPNSDNILEFLASEAAARTEGDGADPGTAAIVPHSPTNMLVDNDFAFMWFGFGQGFVPEFTDFNTVGPLLDTTSPKPSTSPFDPGSIQSRATAIVSELHGLHNTLIESEPWYDASFDINIATSVFSAENLCLFAATYFRASHLDFPVIHRPKFGTESTTKPLLLAVGLAGSLRSPPSDDALAARSFLTLGEEYIFRALGRLMPLGSTPEFTHDVEEALQAALMIHSVQFFRNDIKTRRRNRTLRLPTLVSAVRCLGLAQTRHAPVFQFEEFIRNESRIRLATWTALGDWEQSGMFNVPPLITPTEMTCSLPAALELWDAKDEAEYFEAAHAQGVDGSRRISSVKHCVDALMSEHWNGMGSFPFQDITGSDLQILIFALNGIVLSANLMGLLSSSTQAILRAVSRWELMWETIRSRLDPVAFEKSGLVRYNSELSWAAKKIIQVAISGDKSSAYMQKVGHDSLVQIHEFVRQYRDL
ncbi:Activator of stress genes 2 [Colletotrichum chlorophyti]|uniref:Activator of stress genes 2 n=1 Tax=Colletotrichum chlorophyti TaxID=708187 RepID=A0A1Q8RWH0_9PEZI|nr:Activator of stress genes 2 [Colletotrichum chlorophyti]